MEANDLTLKMYAAVLVYAHSSPAADFKPLYEETVTLIQASSREHAAERARELASSTRETSYQNSMGETITLTLKHLVDVSQITDEIGDGADIYTRHFENYEAYRAFEMLQLTDEASGDRERENQASAQPGDS
jgi:hypothetical protein